jgi:hypothetical protein
MLFEVGRNECAMKAKAWWKRYEKLWVRACCLVVLTSTIGKHVQQASTSVLTYCTCVQQARTSVLTYCTWRIRYTWFYSTVAKQYGAPYDGAHKHPQYEIQHFSKNRFRSSSYCNNIVTTQRYDHLTHNGLESFQNGRQLTEKWCCNGYNGVNGGFSARLLRWRLMGLDCWTYVHLILIGTYD